MYYIFNLKKFFNIWRFSNFHRGITAYLKPIPSFLKYIIFVFLINVPFHKTALINCYKNASGSKQVQIPNLLLISFAQLFQKTKMKFYSYF